MTDINSYLTALAKRLVIDPNKKERIEVSILFLVKEVWGLFQNKLSDIFVFGSYDRDTIILTDDEADVDILIIFKKNEFQPDTYLKHIREFCEKKYPNSIIYPDHPTITLEMEHIKFEIVPATNYLEGTVKIPAPRGKELKWISTSPQIFKSKLQSKDKSNKGLIMPVIRIFKYWNSIHGHPFSSYKLEKCIIEKLYDCSSLRDYYFSASSAIESILSTEQQTKSFADLKERNRRLRVLEREKLTEYIEPELTAFLPMI